MDSKSAGKVFTSRLSFKRIIDDGEYRYQKSVSQERACRGRKKFNFKIPEFYSEETAFAQNFSDETHQSQSDRKAEPHKQSVQSRRSYLVVTCKRLCAGKNYTVDDYQRQLYAQRFVQIGHKLVQYERNYGNKGCYNEDESRDTDFVGNNVTQQTH